MYCLFIVVLFAVLISPQAVAKESRSRPVVAADTDAAVYAKCRALFEREFPGRGGHISGRRTGQTTRWYEQCILRKGNPN